MVQIIVYYKLTRHERERKREKTAKGILMPYRD
jgi:hypothetical protein